MIIEAGIPTEAGIRKKHITIDKKAGEIISVTEPGGFPDVKIEGILFPGFIDIHVHAREYAVEKENAETSSELAGQMRKENFLSAGRAAVNGGVTAFAEMPNNPSPPYHSRNYSRKTELAGKAAIDTLLYAAVTENSAPFGNVPYKFMMNDKPAPYAFTSLEKAETALKRYRGLTAAFHCEDPDTLRKNAAEKKHHRKRPAEAEIRAVERVLNWTEKYDLKTHIVHISTKEGLELIESYNRGKVQGERITCEATPHHLFFSLERRYLLNAEEFKNRCRNTGLLLNMNPPLRSEEDRKYLVSALESGAVDMIATDHAPHTLQDKDKGAAGVPHLDTVASFASWLIQEEKFSLKRIAQILSEAPGRFFSRFSGKKYGKIEPGYRASFTVLDIDHPLIVKKENLKTKCGWSPFEGMSFPGRAVEVWSAGRRIRLIQDE